MNNLVKIIADDDGEPIAEPVWCLITVSGGSDNALCTGEYFGAGESLVVFELKETRRGGITCQRCLRIIREMKAVKL